jgi:hypothetical protein
MFNLKINKSLSVLILSIILYVNSFAQLSKIDVDKSINISSLEHPYLYFNELEKRELLKRILEDQESNDVFRKLKAQAKVWMVMPVDKNIPIQGKNTRANWSEEDRNGKYANYYKSNLHNSYHLAFLYQMTGVESYAQKAFEFADAFCDLTTWTQRAHEFPVIYSRIMPWNVPDDQVNFNFDHFNGDAGRMMAAVYDWLYPALSQLQRDRIRGALLEKVVTRVRGDYEFHWWATAYRCNWCGVCNSGVGLAGLTLLKEHPQLTDIVAESYNRINSMLNELGKDGGWQEGGSYWNYGVHTSSFFADALKRLSDGKHNLFKNKRLNENPASFPLYLSLPGNKSLNFEDSGGYSLIGSPHLINKLATETENEEAAWYRSNFLGEGDGIFDIIWPRPSSIGVPPKNPSKHFRTIDWWVMRSDFMNPNKVIVAGKAGKNDDPHHGHLDVGHFVVYWKNEYFIRDLGKSGYDEKYFDEARFDYPEATSSGHNTILVNGEQQISAKYYKQPYDYSIGGEVLSFQSSDELDYVLMDPTNAYPNKELKKWRRSVLLKKPELTIVLDEIKTSLNAEIKVRFHSGVKVEIHDKLVMLEGKKGKMILIPILDQKFEIKSGRHTSQMVNGTEKFKWIDYFDIKVISKKEITNLITLILPVKDLNEARQIEASKSIEIQRDGSFQINFVKGDDDFEFSFEMSKEGLIYKK